jgi:hypothetical protein
VTLRLTPPTFPRGGMAIAPSTTEARSASGTATPMRRGDTAPLSERAEQVRTTASRSTLPSAQPQACRSLGRPAPRGTTNRCSSLRCSTRYALAASGPRLAQWTRATTTRASTESAKLAVSIRSSRSGAQRGKQPALPLTTGGRLFPRIARHTGRFWSLYRRRALIEREFAHLKREHALAALRVRGLERVQLHTDLTILARLALALSRAQEGPSTKCRESSGPPIQHAPRPPERPEHEEEGRRESMHPRAHHSSSSPPSSHADRSSVGREGFCATACTAGLRSGAFSPKTPS